MTLFRKVNKMLASLGNTKAMKRLDKDIPAEGAIPEIQGNKIAESEEGTIYAGIEELNGYLFLETAMVTLANLKTFEGAKLAFSGEANFELSSDTQEIVSEFSNHSNRFISRITFDVTEEEINLIRDKKYEKVILKLKKKAITLFLPE